MDFLIVPMIIIPIAVVTFLIVSKINAMKERTAKFKEITIIHGFEFVFSFPEPFLDEREKTDLLGMGHGREIRNGMHTKSNIKIYDYQYQTGMQGNGIKFNQTVFEWEDYSKTPFILKPKHLAHTLHNAPGKKDINFEAHPLFSKKIYLKSSDEDSTRLLFKPELIQFCENHLKFSLQAHGNRIFWYRSDHLIKPEKIREMLDEFERLIALLT